MLSDGRRRLKRRRDARCDPASRGEHVQPISMIGARRIAAHAHGRRGSCGRVIQSANAAAEDVHSPDLVLPPSDRWRPGIERALVGDSGDQTGCLPVIRQAATGLNGRVEVGSGQCTVRAVDRGGRVSRLNALAVLALWPEMDAASRPFQGRDPSLRMRPRTAIPSRSTMVAHIRVRIQTASCSPWQTPRPSADFS